MIDPVRCRIEPGVLHLDPVQIATLHGLGVKVNAIDRVPLMSHENGEICRRCGLPVAAFTGSWWKTDAALWERVVGDDGIILCPPCFTGKAWEKGILVHWEAHVEGEDV